ncbi:MAG: DUF3299 domain-containing protein [Pseudomonadota bacterium]
MPQPSRVVHLTAATVITVLLLGFGPGAVADEGPRELNWDDLVPASGPLEIDADGQESPEQTPVYGSGTVAALSGDNIKLPGFVVPLDLEGEQVSSFLLVPYFGACIHYPPPPPNQTVFVELEDSIDIETMYYPVWVTGVLSTERMTSELAEAAYRMAGTAVEKFEY